jgi:hypothetical protein
MTAGWAELIKLYEAIRQQESPDTMLDILQAAKRSDLALDVEDLKVFLNWMAEDGSAICPEWIVRFIALILRDMPPRTILDPAAAIGSLIGPLMNQLKNAHAVAICRGGAEYALAPNLNPVEGIAWRKGDPLAEIRAMEETFDCVVAFFPPSGETRTISWQTGDGALTLTGTEAHLILFLAGIRLKEWGVGIFVLPDEPIITGNASIWTHLKDHGIYLDAALMLPKGMLLIVRRTPPGHLFSGVLLPDQSTQDILAKNYAIRREGKGPALGILMAPDHFPRFRDVLRERDIEQRMQDTGAEPVKVGAIAREIHSWSGSGFPERANALYWSADPHLPVVVSSREITTDPREAVQIVLIPARASAEYVARFLATPVGTAIRELVGRRTEQISLLDAIRDTTVYLPPREIQDAILSVQASITHIRSSIGDLEWNLWMHPHRVDRVRRMVEERWVENDIEQWMETLPFPLASILWAERATRNSDHRIDHLFHFFEAASEFLVIIMLSALAPLCIEKKVDLLEDDPFFRDSYRFATFRAWNVLGRRLARHTRKLMSSPQTRDACIRRYGNPDTAFIEILTGKRLFAILDGVADLRNVWKAHGGIAGEGEMAGRLIELEGALAEFRRVIGSSFADFLLLSPLESTFHDGIFAYQAEALQGTRMPPRTVGIETNTPMDTDRLYLLYRNQRTPVALLPLMRLIRTPEMRACYFYNRIEGDHVRWISYHFEQDGEFVAPAPEVVQLLADLGLIIPGNRS